MATHAKLGRNDLCACGSGKKFKNCCEVKTSATSLPRVLMAALAIAVLGGIAAGVIALRDASSATAAPGKVWSAEHGHFH